MVMFYMKSESVSKAMEVESHLDDFWFYISYQSRHGHVLHKSESVSKAMEVESHLDDFWFYISYQSRHGHVLHEIRICF